MNTSVEYLPTAIHLSGGLTARIDLAPMPRPEKSGFYKPRQDCESSVSLFRRGELIERRPWDSFVCDADAVSVADGSVLGAEDLLELDCQGWREMLSVGMIPGA
jgi:hypothetical protein